MKKITITVVFNQSGHGFINVIPTNFTQWNPVQSSSNNYNLDPGDYLITYLTATENGGSITVTENGSVLAGSQLSGGADGGNFTITV
jgi:hypothetical protein